MKPGKQKLPKAPSMLVDLKETFVSLTKEEDDDRVKRLARKIIRVLEGSRKRQTTAAVGVDSLFDSDFEKSLGI